MLMVLCHLIFMVFFYLMVIHLLSLNYSLSRRLVVSRIKCLFLDISLLITYVCSSSWHPSVYISVLLSWVIFSHCSRSVDSEIVSFSENSWLVSLSDVSGDCSESLNFALVAARVLVVEQSVSSSQINIRLLGVFYVSPVHFSRKVFFFIQYVRGDNSLIITKKQKTKKNPCLDLSSCADNTSWLMKNTESPTCNSTFAFSSFLVFLFSFMLSMCFTMYANALCCLRRIVRSNCLHYNTVCEVLTGHLWAVQGVYHTSRKMAHSQSALMYSYS